MLRIPNNIRLYFEISNSLEAILFKKLVFFHNSDY